MKFFSFFFLVAIRHTNVGRFEVSTVPKVSRTHAHLFSSVVPGVFGGLKSGKKGKFC